MIKRAIFSVVLMLLLIGGWVFYQSVYSPYKGFTANEVFLEIERGQSALGIARELSQAGIVQTPWHFMAVRAMRGNDRLLAGEYRFAEPASVWTVFDRISRGDIYLIRFTVPEGYTIFDIAAAYEEAKLGTKDEFLTQARDPALIRDLAPQARTLEGYLFPDTYRLRRRTPAPVLCKMMTDKFRKTWESLGSRGAVHRTVTLASLVEKETGVDAERPLVASVFENRLLRNIPLECDPTVIYAALLEGRYRGTIYRSDLDSQNPYNTYQNPGLPPGPIANPGLESLIAALEPAQTEYIFFVAKPGGSGAHTFSETLQDHNAAVDVYRRGLSAGRDPAE